MTDKSYEYFLEKLTIGVLKIQEYTYTNFTDGLYYINRSIGINDWVKSCHTPEHIYKYWLIYSRESVRYV